MPFVGKILTENGILGIWELTEQVEEFVSDFQFSEKELVEYHKISASKRKIEYLTARKTLETLLGFKAEISYYPDGRPFIEGNNLNLSISHSSDLVAVFISETNCGVDVENLNRNIDRVATRFLHRSELEQIEKTPDHQLFKILSWCAKEAIFKCSYQNNVQFNEQIYIELPDGAENSLFNGTLVFGGSKEYFAMWFFVHKNNMIVYCVEMKNNSE